MANITKTKGKELDEKNVHAGHRERLFNLAFKVGLDKLTFDVVLE